MLAALLVSKYAAKVGSTSVLRDVPDALARRSRPCTDRAFTAPDQSAAHVHKRPRGCRAADKRDELAASHVRKLSPHAVLAGSPGHVSQRRPLAVGFVARSSLPQSGRQVLGADLNCSESRYATAPSGQLPFQVTHRRHSRNVRSVKILPLTANIDAPRQPAGAP